MKAINSLVNRQEDEQDNRNVIKLTTLDFTGLESPKASVYAAGCRVKVVVKEKQRNPHTKIVTKVREVTYLREQKVKDEVGFRYETLTTKGFEIVEEISVPTKECPVSSLNNPEVVDSVTRDLRPKREAQ